MITRESIEERKKSLLADIGRAQQELAKAQAMVSLLDGALQDCDWFLSQMEAEEGSDEPSSDTP